MVPGLGGRDHREVAVTILLPRADRLSSLAGRFGAFVGRRGSIPCAQCMWRPGTSFVFAARGRCRTQHRIQLLGRLHTGRAALTGARRATPSLSSQLVGERGDTSGQLALPAPHKSRVIRIVCKTYSKCTRPTRARRLTTSRAGRPPVSGAMALQVFTDFQRPHWRLVGAFAAGRAPARMKRKPSILRTAQGGRICVEFSTHLSAAFHFVIKRLSTATMDPRQLREFED